MLKILSDGSDRVARGDRRKQTGEIRSNVSWM
jgi:hypothetical protein